MKNGPQVQQDDDEETTLEAEEPKDDSKADRKSRKRLFSFRFLRTKHSLNI